MRKSMPESLFTGGDDARTFEARIIAEHVTGDSYSELMVSSYELTQRQAEDVDRIIAQRNGGKPLAYILHSVTFRELDLYVDERVLIPRSETEIVVQYALDILSRHPEPVASRHPEPAKDLNVIDIGTGSGAIALSIAYEEMRAQVYATDISTDALDVARLNGVATGSAAVRVKFYCGDLFSALPVELRGTVDVIVSNPPYIGNDEKEEIDSAVLEHEPHIALFSGEEGSDIYDRIIDRGREWLKSDGHVVLEIAPRHVEFIKQSAIDSGYTKTEIFSDLTGRERIAVLAL
ncbi:MAG TPA: peptide chain release factor N(5)-glutamine methyltransferase [Acidimicrobiia bacterium]|nr:peptide chain release factor N(5)-glutamine methyltransferase [Acidimicrobiia bacterium]